MKRIRMNNTTTPTATVPIKRPTLEKVSAILFTFITAPAIMKHTPPGVSLLNKEKTIEYDDLIRNRHIKLSSIHIFEFALTNYLI